jgi:hypothetical protein
LALPSLPPSECNLKVTISDILSVLTLCTVDVQVFEDGLFGDDEVLIVCDKCFFTAHCSYYLSLSFYLTVPPIPIATTSHPQRRQSSTVACNFHYSKQLCSLYCNTAKGSTLRSFHFSDMRIFMSYTVRKFRQKLSLIIHKFVI